MRRYKVGKLQDVRVPQGAKLAPWLLDMGPGHTQTESSRQAAKAAAIEKREKRAAKWRERLYT